MKKRLVKSLFISLGVMACVSLPNVANAAEFSFGSVTKNDNVNKIPVILEVDEGDSIQNIKFSCETDNTEATCVVEKVSDSVFSGEVSNNILVATYVDTTGENNPLTEAGNYTVATLVITNNSTARISGLKVSLKSATIDGVSVSKSVNTDIQPKKEVTYSSDATLKSLKISQGKMSPDFSSDVKEYTIYGIADTVNSIRLTPECNDGSCSFNISGGKSVDATKSQVTLNQGENTVKIEVDSEDGLNQETYTLTIYRGETTYNSAKLASITTGEYTLTPAFSSEVTEYTLTVPNTTSNLVNILEYQAEDENAKVTVQGIDNFTEGQANLLTITVDNVNGDETITYTIKVTRLSVENIEILKYIDNKVTFKDSEGIQTTLDIDIFKANYPNEYNKIINNEYQFDPETGEIIIANNTSTDDEEEEEKEEKKPSKTWLIVVLVIAGLAIIGVSGFFIFRKKKPEDDKELGDSLVNEEDEDSVKVVEDAETNEESSEVNDEEVIDETGIEEKLVESETVDPDKTMDVDEALEDLMNTKQYDFNFVDDDE